MPARLLEREPQVAELARLLNDARDGHGSAIVLEGEAGIGKTAVLDALAADIDRATTTVLRAAGGQLEGDAPFGVVRELFAPALQGADRGRLLQGTAALCGRVFGEEGPGDLDAGAVLHGLYWLTVNLTEDRPLVLLVDDLQWCDAPSARFLDHLARRLDDLPCLAALASRPGRATFAATALGDAPGVQRRVLPPLGPASVEAIVSEVLGEAVDDDFAAACREAAGGNAFLTLSLAGELRSRGVHGRAADVGEIAAVGAGEVAVSVRRRLADAGPGATAVAHAVAVLGPSATYRRACALADVEATEGEREIALLVAERLLVDARPLTFAHPLLRTAVYEDMTVGERGRWHARAAALLAQDGEREQAAHHLRLAEPLGDQGAVAVLREAARRAVGRGAPDVAVVYLARALEEPPGPDERVALLAELATAELHIGLMGAAVAHLEEAVAAATDPVVRAGITLQLAVTVQWAIDAGRGARMLADLAASLPAGAPDHATMALLVAASASGAVRPVTADAVARLRERRDFAADEQALVAILAVELAMTSGPAQQAALLARRALASDDLLDQNQLLAPTHELASMAATCAGAPAVGLDGLDRAIAHARDRGSETSYARALSMRGWTRLRMGELAEAEADLRGVVELPDARAANPILRMATVGSLTQVTLHREGPAPARAVLDELDDGGENPRSAPDQQLLLARAMVALAELDACGALTHLQPCRAFEADFGGACPSYVPWRPLAVAAHLLLGEHDAARALADTYRAHAEAYGAAEVVGVALHSAGLVDRDIALLEQAVDVLGRSSARLAHTQALVDLGGALRASRRQVEAREPLRLALDMAARCGAGPLGERAREELLATGARPRRAHLQGWDALTPTELRIARLATTGLTNRQIAEAGFVSSRTVAMHLSNSYRKLGVSGRQDLTAAMLPAMEAVS